MKPRLIKHVPVYERINLDYPPIVNSRLAAVINAIITAGDLHANAKKLLYILIYHGFFYISDEDYIRFCNIYNKPIELITSDDIKSICEIINNMRVNDNAVNSTLELIGDELADRGKNDYFIWKLLEKIVKSKINLVILASNHSMNFIHCVEANTKFEAPKMPMFFSQSIYNLQYLIDKNLVSRDEIINLYRTIYIPNLKAINCTLGKDNINTFTTHAPSGRRFISELVQDINFMNLNIRPAIVYEDDTPEKFKKTIDQINENITILANENKLSLLYECNNKAFQNLVWNRNYKPDFLQRSNQDRYVNGHDMGKSPDMNEADKQYYQLSASAENVCQLDNECGKTDIYSTYPCNDIYREEGNYSILYTNDEKQHNYGTFYSETIEELKNSTLLLLKEYDLEKIELPQNKTYEFYDSFYNIILILKNQNLASFENLNAILTSELLQSEDKIKLFENCLVEMKQTGLLSQAAFNKLVKNNEIELKNAIKSAMLYNHVSIIKPDINKKNIKPSTFQSLHHVLGYCHSTQQNILNYSIYQCILSNLDKIQELELSAKTSLSHFMNHLVSLGCSRGELPREYLLNETINFVNTAFSLQEDTIKSLSASFTLVYSAEDLWILQNFLYVSHSQILNSQMDKEIFYKILLNPHYLTPAIKIWRIKGDEAMQSEFKDIFGNPNAILILRFFSRYSNNNSNDMSYYLYLAMFYNNNQLLTPEFVSFIENHPAPETIAYITSDLSNKGLLNSDNISLMIANPTLNSNDLIQMIMFRDSKSIINEIHNESMSMNSSSDSLSSMSTSASELSNPAELNTYNNKSFPLTFFATYDDIEIESRENINKLGYQ